MSKHLVIVGLVLGSVVGCRPTGALPALGAKAPDEQKPYFLAIAEREGWLENYKRGTEIIQRLSALGPEGQKKIDITAYRGERVAFFGCGAPPGGTHDVMTKEGFYL